MIDTNNIMTNWKYLPELPDTDRLVLVAMHADKSPNIAQLYEGRWWTWDMETYFSDRIDIVYAWAELPELPPVRKPCPIDVSGRVVQIKEDEAMSFFGIGLFGFALTHMIARFISSLRAIEKHYALKKVTDLHQEGLSLTTYLQMRAAIENPHVPCEVIVTKETETDNPTYTTRMSIEKNQ
jgi:hypothetical protein